MIHLPPLHDQVWDTIAEALGADLLREHEPVIIGQCEIEELFYRAGAGPWRRCRSTGMGQGDGAIVERYLCPRHGADLALAVRRWPK